MAGARASRSRLARDDTLRCKCDRGARKHRVMGFASAFHARRGFARLDVVKCDAVSNGLAASLRAPAGRSRGRYACGVDWRHGPGALTVRMRSPRTARARSRGCQARFIPREAGSTVRQWGVSSHTRNARILSSETPTIGEGRVRLAADASRCRFFVVATGAAMASRCLGIREREIPPDRLDGVNRGSAVMRARRRRGCNA